jgi:hypothetical protein
MGEVYAYCTLSLRVTLSQPWGDDITAKQFRESAGREILGRRLADIARMNRAWRRQNLANVKRIIAEAEELKRKITIVGDGEGVEP